MQAAYKPQIDLMDEDPEDFNHGSTIFNLRRIEDLEDIERKVLNQGRGPAQVQFTFERSMGDTLESFYQSFMVALYEKSLFFENPLEFWEELVWKIDSNPLFDKSDEIGGSVSLHLNDVIQASVQVSNARPMVLQNHIKPAIQAFYSKMAFTSFPQDVNSLLNQFTWNSIMKQRKGVNDNEEEKQPASLTHLMPPSSSINSLSDFFRVRIIIICKESASSKAQILKYTPQSNFPHQLFSKNYFASQDIIMAVGEQEGWRIIYGAHQHEEVKLLNSSLDLLTGPYEVKHEFTQQSLLEFIPLACGCCPGVRRASLLSYLDRQFPPSFKLEDRFISYDQLNRPHRPLCLNSVPLCFETIEKIIQTKLDYAYLGKRIELAFNSSEINPSVKQSRTSIKKIKKYQEPLIVKNKQSSRQSRSSSAKLDWCCCCPCFLSAVAEGASEGSNNDF